MAIKAVAITAKVVKFIGASTDTKPTIAAHTGNPEPTVGSTYYEYDTGILYITYDGTNWVEKDTIVRLEASPTIDIGDVTLLPNSGVDIGDVDVTSIIPGVAATNLGKAEDAAHTSGDTGIQILGVRDDAGKGLSSADGDYTVPSFDRFNGIRLGNPVFGEPTLSDANNGSANWARGSVSPLDQKSPTGWLACLYGGLQTGDDWARINIPIDELLTTKFAPDTYQTAWTYWMTNAETMGVNIVIWLHDPTDPSKRVEVTQQANIATLSKAQGWNRHILDETVSQFYYYGENVSGSGLTSGTNYTWHQFQTDVIFSTWTIYRITIEYGWEAAGTFEDAFVADIKLNGIPIQLKPDKGGTGIFATRKLDVDTGAVALTIAPKTPFRLISLDVHASAVLDTGEVFTLTKDAGAGANFDTVVYSDDYFIGSRTSVFVPFGEGYDFPADDEIDIAQANGSNDDIGVRIVYQTVFG